jgi:hypothetical protein
MQNRLIFEVFRGYCKIIRFGEDAALSQKFRFFTNYCQKFETWHFLCHCIGVLGSGWVKS